MGGELLAQEIHDCDPPDSIVPAAEPAQEATPRVSIGPDLDFYLARARQPGLFCSPDAQMPKKSEKAAPVAVPSRSGDVHEHSPDQRTWSGAAPGLGAILLRYQSIHSCPLDSPSHLI